MSRKIEIWRVTMVLASTSLRSRVSALPGDLSLDACWTLEQQQGYIEAMLQDRLTDTQVWSRKSGDDGLARFCVVDGVRRLRAIWQFGDGKLPLSCTCGPIDGEVVAGLRYDELPEVVRARFLAYEFAVFLFDVDDDVVEVFERINRVDGSLGTIESGNLR
ncbi:MULTISPECIES: hypothetical protein [Burkholderia]|uniref:Uncharacterized protein n=1 Tax=Burkholderia lata (strain ATCC 17760 / DSM 23089 / LMG 22485 / NCIMB 9086 / R18194 / 383) TaxID=482957 RepID=A0A6P2KAG3_BURL3|nr:MULTISPECIES: hypothetical protein [Burkholderia]MBN3796094.1 hypothetical protein [Burkholderia sp. Ac-20392]VWB53310.1 hypothetical protein BLA6863_02444 [Burkholderia lata]